MLCHAVFRATAEVIGQRSMSDETRATWRQVTESSGRHITEVGGVPAVIRRYGKDHTFSVPIYTLRVGGDRGMEGRDSSAIRTLLRSTSALRGGENAGGQLCLTGVDRDRSGHLQASGTLEPSRSHD